MIHYPFSEKIVQFFWQIAYYRGIHLHCNGLVSELSVVVGFHNENMIFYSIRNIRVSGYNNWDKLDKTLVEADEKNAFRQLAPTK